MKLMRLICNVNISGYFRIQLTVLGDCGKPFIPHWLLQAQTALTLKTRNLFISHDFCNKWLLFP
jgi:hypothetical protein